MGNIFYTEDLPVIQMRKLLIDKEEMVKYLFNDMVNEALIDPEKDGYDTVRSETTPQKHNLPVLDVKFEETEDAYIDTTDIQDRFEIVEFSFSEVSNFEESKIGDDSMDEIPYRELIKPTTDPALVKLASVQEN